MTLRNVMLMLVAVAVASAGCAAPEDAGEGQPTTPTSATPTPTPASPTPTTPEGGLGGDGAALATSIELTEAPTRGPGGRDVMVCWRVEGVGVVQHTAVHWDDESHQNEDATFQDYGGGLAFPDNESAPAEGGYTLPGGWCTNVPVPENGSHYYVAHVIDSRGPPGMITDEKNVSATPEVTSVSVVDPPTSVAAGEAATVCWRVEGGSGSIPHTAVHWDDESHVGDEVTFQDYGGGLGWPDNETAPLEMGWTIPDTFCSSIPTESPGTLYFRAHAIGAAGPPGVLSEEHTLTVE